MARAKRTRTGSRRERGLRGKEEEVPRDERPRGGRSSRGMSVETMVMLGFGIFIVVAVILLLLISSSQNREEARKASIRAATARLLEEGPRSAVNRFLEIFAKIRDKALTHYDPEDYAKEGSKAKYTAEWVTPYLGGDVWLLVVRKDYQDARNKPQVLQLTSDSSRMGDPESGRKVECESWQHETDRIKGVEVRHMRIDHRNYFRCRLTTQPERAEVQGLPQGQMAPSLTVEATILYERE